MYSNRIEKILKMYVYLINKKYEYIRYYLFVKNRVFLLEIKWMEVIMYMIVEEFK